MFACLRVVAKENVGGGVFHHRAADKVLFFKAVVDASVVVQGLRGEKGDIGMEIADSIFGVSAHQHGRVLRGHLPACGVGADIIFRQKTQGVDAVGDDADILEFLQVFRDIESGRRAVQKDDVPVLDKFYGG